MKTQSPDTHPKIEAMLIEAYRKMTPQEKMRRVLDMNEFGYHLALASVRQRHPNADERECLLRIVSLYLPTDLMRKAFGWDPDEKGY